jgi:hypothetical protein
MFATHLVAGVLLSVGNVEWVGATGTHEYDNEAQL